MDDLPGRMDDCPKPEAMTQRNCGSYGLVAEQRMQDQITGEPMKFLMLANWTGMALTTLFARKLATYCPAPVRYKRAVSRSSVISRAMTSGVDRFVNSSNGSSFSQKMSGFPLSRLALSS
jgi:hypothetical protein